MPTTHPWVPLDVPGPYRTITQRLTEVAHALPDHSALASPGQHYTFAEVEWMTGQVASRLLARWGGAPDSAPVGLIAHGDAEAMLMFLSIVRSGRTAVVLDSQIPLDRLAQIAVQAGVTVCVSDRPEEVSTQLEDVERLSLAELMQEAELQKHADPASLHDATSGLTQTLGSKGETPACIVFTSGSTGQPKGVTYPHRTLLNEAFAARTRLDFGPGDQTALVLPFAFAAGLAVIVMALLNGAGLYVYDPRDHGIRGLPSTLRDQRLSTLHATPSLLRSLLGVLAPEEKLEDLRLVTTCGEAIYGRDVTTLRTHLSGDAVFTSWSGSSETGHLAFYRIEPKDTVPHGAIPVGEPAPNKTVELWGENGKQVSAGETGEVVVTSEFLTSGYWRDPEATADRFTFLDGDHASYRMGDLARFDEEGRLHLLGRNDSAVKVRGYLVEPAEIEAALLAEEDIAEAVVVPCQQPPAATRLVAYVAPSPHHRTPSRAQVRRRLHQALPEWMVPNHIVQLDTLPRNERGKIDRAGLPSIEKRSDPQPPRYEWEVVLADMWCSVLELDSVGRNENFGQLGGDSLGVEELLTQVQQRFGVSVTAGQFAAAADLAEFAMIVAGADDPGSPSPDRDAPQPLAANAFRRPSQVPARHQGTVIGLQEQGDRPGLFCFTGAGAGALSFSSLARHVGSEQPLYALQPHGLERRAVPSWTVGSAARRHLRALRAVQPHGPYLLAGHSLGGLVAIAAAHQLAASGQEVPLLVIMDAYLPRSIRRLASAEEGVLDRPVLPQPAPLPRAELWRRRLRLPLAGLLHSDPHRQSGNLEELGRRMVEFHRPKPWPGPAIVYQTYENPDPPALWQHVLTGPIQLRTVACDHASIVREPHVQPLAAQINQDIDSILSKVEA